MARQNIFLERLNNYTIDSIGAYTQEVRNFLDVRLGGVYTYCNDYRLSNMMNNPQKARYNMVGSSAGGDFVGEKYSIDNDVEFERKYLDEVGGLQGFTHDAGFNETINTEVQRNMEQAVTDKVYKIRERQNLYGDLGEDYYVTDYPEGLSGVRDNDILNTDLDRLKSSYSGEHYKGTLPQRNNEDVRQEIIKQRINAPYPSKYLGDTFSDIGVSKNIFDENYSTDESSLMAYGESIDTPTFSVNDTGTVTISKVNPNSKTYNLYDEDGKFIKGRNENVGTYNTIGLLIDGSEKEIEKSTLLNRTNKFFQEGKISSLINRFHTSDDYYGKEKSLTQSAGDSKYGMSRGRNLTKVGNATTHDGYDNPYCRVWTSHYQYSKIQNLIRHNGFDKERDRFGEGVLRPNDGIDRLSRFSSLQKNGFPRIVPKKDNPEEVKKCMFSIENLAWKDIIREAKVDAKNNKFGRVLSKEQIGPNGGRIMWFPPYNLKFNENVSINWNSNNFIGRGEPIYTYTNTERSGTLSFTILVDHPSVVDSWAYGRKVTYDNEQTLLRFFAGCDDGGSNAELGVKEMPIKKTVNTTVSKIVEKPLEKEPSVDAKPDNEIPDVQLKYFVFFPNNFTGMDYAKTGDVKTPLNYLLSGKNHGVNGYEIKVNGSETDGLRGCINSETIKGGQMKGGGEATWHYEVDKMTVTEALLPTNYEDKSSFGLNNSSGFRDLIKKDNIQNTLHVTPDEVDKTFTLQDLVKTNFRDLKTFFTNKTGNVQDDEFEITCFVKGYASDPGKKNMGEEGLAKRRAKFLKKYLESLNFTEEEKISVVDSGVIGVPKGNRDISSIEHKIGRCAEVVVKLIRKNNTPNVDKTADGLTLSVENREQAEVKTEITNEQSITTEVITETEYAHYDDEYRYFKEINDGNDLVKRNLIEKVQYFDPAFHSITPEGFNARLTFLHQCTRQGPTVSASDMEGRTPMGAGNLSFGRPPVCVLRVGDFYFTKIIIDSFSIDYDTGGGIQWDLNPEGIGIQPMMANITLGIKFLGGSDLSGPIARLQNAVSYNFFANASAYDRRADYREGWITQNKDEAQTWSPILVNQTVDHEGNVIDKEHPESVSTRHKPYSTYTNSVDNKPQNTEKTE